jgi:3-oxoacyl-[acyl-carrier-protein] synthase-3
MGVRILSTGSYVPDAVVTNDHLQQRMGCDPNWVVKQTGIRERRHALPHQATSDLCCEAARACLDRAGVDRRDVDLLLLATITSDMTFPSTACLVQDRLKLNCPAMDLGAACSGFLYALVAACSHLAARTSDLALVVAGDCMSRVSNPADLKTYPLLGDGAGAVLVGRGDPTQGLVSYTLGSDGSGADLLGRKAGGSRLPATAEVLGTGLEYLHMDGRAVFTWAVTILCDTVQDVLADAGLRPGDIDLYVPHQANIRIINAALDVLGIPRGLVFTNLDRYGNTSAASIPLALDEAVADDRIRPGDQVILSGFGAGLTWGTALWRW